MYIVVKGKIKPWSRSKGEPFVWWHIFYVQHLMWYLHVFVQFEGVTRLRHFIENVSGFYS
jgi:hypothetical protein